MGAAPEKWTPELTWLNWTRQESLPEKNYFALLWGAAAPPPAHTPMCSMQLKPEMTRRRDSLQSHTTCEGRVGTWLFSLVTAQSDNERFTLLSRSIAVILTGARKKCATVERSSGRHRRRRSCCWVSCGITKPSVQSNLTQSHIVAGPRSRIIQPYLPDSANVYPHLKDGFLGPREFLSQAAFRSVHPFLQDSRVCPSHRHRDRRTHRTPYITTYVAMSRICAMHVIQPTNIAKPLQG